MMTICFYVESTDKAYDTLDYVIDRFPCFVRWESVEMNYIEVSITARVEDIPSVEKIFAEIV